MTFKFEAGYNDRTFVMGDDDVLQRIKSLQSLSTGFLLPRLNQRHILRQNLYSFNYMVYYLAFLFWNIPNYSYFSEHIVPAIENSTLATQMSIIRWVFYNKISISGGLKSMFYQIVKSSWNPWYKVYQKSLIGNHVTGDIIWGKN